MARKKERIKPKNPVFAELSDKIYNTLSMADITSIEELVNFYPDDNEGGIRRVRGIGKKTFNELTEFLEKHGRTWKQRRKQK